MQPIIGITCNYDYSDAVGLTSHMGVNGQDWDFVAGDYIYAVERAGGLPVIIPQTQDFDTLHKLIEKLDGIIISGGHDVDASLYNEMPFSSGGTIVPQRDAQDIEAVRFAYHETNIPILGICRGVQILNVAFNGTLYRDIQTEANCVHPFGGMYPRNYPWHSVTLSEGSRLRSIFGKDTIKVNSFHHQAVKTVSGSAVITAVAPDGIPEAIELPGDRFVLGVQWHPEMMFDSSEQQELIKAFVNACI